MVRFTWNTGRVHGEELTPSCRFQTARLAVVEWHNSPLRAGDSLADVVATLLTSTTTWALPSSWRGDYDRARADDWIRDRDSESAVSLATDRDTGIPVGLIIVFEAPCNDNSGRVDIRLGFLLAESVWGRGLGTEMVAGFVKWSRSTPRVRSIAGGVGLDNTASVRALAKNGFVPTGTADDGEQLYELVLPTNQ